jgi:sugar lactone lactonase YvrE
MINFYCIAVAPHVPNLDENASWTQDGIKVAGGKRWGNDLSHLNFPSGIYIDDDDETIYIADYSNHRIMEWKSGAKSGQVVAGEGEPSGRTERLRNPVEVLYDKATDSFIIADEGNKRVVLWPRQPDLNVQILAANVDPWGITVDHEGYLYVCDHKKHEVKRWKLGEPIGTVVAGGNGKGPRLKQLSLPTCIFVDKEQSVYVSDWANHRIVKWEKDAKKGILIAGGQNQLNFPLPLADPFGLIVDHSGNLFIADWGKHRIVRYSKGAIHSSIVVGEGGNGSGPNQLCHPMSLAFDRRGNLYVSDYSNNRVQKFNIKSNSIEEKSSINNDEQNASTNNDEEKPSANNDEEKPSANNDEGKPSINQDG